MSIYRPLLFLLLLISCLAIGEVSLRLLNIGAVQPMELYNNVIAKAKPNISWLNKKGNLNYVTFNNLGFHDYNRKNKNDKYRIAFLGDSFVEGNQVPIDSLFTSHLNTMFTSYGLDYEALNFGVSGAGTAYQYQLSKTFIEDNVDVDHMVLCLWMGNDLEDNHISLGSAPTNFGIYLDKFGNVTMNRVNYPFFQRVVKSITNYSVLFNTIYQRLYILKRHVLNANKKRNQSNIDNNKNLVLDDRLWLETISGTIKLILKWNKELMEKGKYFSIIILHTGEFHVTDQIYNNEYKNSFIRKLSSLCNDNNIPFQEIIFEDNTKEYHFKHGSFFAHFNYNGHHFAANQIFEMIKATVVKY
jgi:hypothetical protein